MQEGVLSSLQHDRLCWQEAVCDVADAFLVWLLPADGPSPLIAEPEVTTHALQEGDEFILLGCDGLWDVFNSQRAVEFARAR